MSGEVNARYFVLILLATVFSYMVVAGIFKWRQAKVGETQNTKKASEMFYPSVTMLPYYEMNYSLAKLSLYKTRKNLTEYYSQMAGIKRDIISIKQSYETGNG